MPNKKQAEVKETPEYHNTYLLLKKYRDVVWMDFIFLRAE